MTLDTPLGASSPKRAKHAASPLASLRVEVLDDWSAVLGLEREWNALLSDSSADSLFLRWEWIRCWADVVQHRIEPRVIAIRDADGDLVGLAPFYLCTLRLGLVIPCRVLRILGDHPTSADYPDWIVRRDVADAASGAIAAALVSLRTWDLIWAPRMAGWTGSFDRIVAACGAAGLRCRTRPQKFASFELPRDKDAYLRSLSSNKRQQLRAERNRISRRTGVEIQRCESEAQLSELMHALFELHGQRWRERGEAGSFVRDPRKATFYRNFASLALAKGWLWLYGLREGGEFKAVQFGYVYCNVYHQMQEGFDTTYLNGAGNVLRARVIEDLIDAGVETYDFLAGMSEHKRRWMSEVRMGHDLLIGRSTARSRLLFATGVWPTTRAMPERVPRVGGARTERFDTPRGPTLPRCSTGGVS